MSPEAREPSLFLATATVVFRTPVGSAVGGPAPDALVRALMRIQDVVAVRVNDDGATTVYRVDVAGETEADAEAQAALPALAAGEALGLEVDVVEVTAVSDAERIATFRRLQSSQRG